MKHEELLMLVSEIGFDMLSFGGEIYRVEETVKKIGEAYGCSGVDVFAIPSTLIVSLQQDGETKTQVRRLKDKGNNLRKVDKLNDLSRKLCRDIPDYETANSWLLQVEKLPDHPLWVLCAAHGFAAMFFAFFFGGNFKDGLWALLIGVLIKLTAHFLYRYGANSFFTTVIQGLISATIALLGAHFHFAQNYNHVLMGAIMNLVPGLMLTNAMRDIMAGDFLAGLTRIAEAVLIGTGIAVGVVVPLSLFQMLGGVLG